MTDPQELVLPPLPNASHWLLWDADGDREASELYCQREKDPAHAPGVTDHRGHRWASEPLFTADQMRACAAEAVARALAASAPSREVPDLEAADDAATMDRMADLLTRTANALLGDPGPLRRWSWHDLPERAAAAIAAIDVMTRAARKLASTPECPDGWKLVPIEPTREMWGELARDIVTWLYMEPAPHYGSKLHKHLRALGREIPDWLLREIADKDVTPSKGTVAVAIFKAMIAAAPSPSVAAEETGHG